MLTRYQEKVLSNLRNEESVLFTDDTNVTELNPCNEIVLEPKSQPCSLPGLRRWLVELHYGGDSETWRVSEIIVDAKQKMNEVEFDAPNEEDADYFPPMVFIRVFSSSAISALASNLIKLKDAFKEKWPNLIPENSKNEDSTTEYLRKYFIK